MQINVTYDSNTLASAPSAFFATVNFVVNLFDTTFTNTATINIEVGYGKFPLDGSTVEKALCLIGSNSTLDGWVCVASNATLQTHGDAWSFSPPATPGSNQVY